MSTSSAAFVRPDPLSARAQAATEQTRQLEADYQASPEQQLARAERHAAGLGNDATAQESARAAVARLRVQVDRGASAPAAGVYLTDTQRIDNALSGVVDHLGAEVTAGAQVPSRDFSGAIADDLALGIDRELLKTFYETGLSNDPEGHIHAATWFRLYAGSEEMQRLHREGDPLICKRFRLASIYAAGSYEPR